MPTMMLNSRNTQPIIARSVVSLGPGVFEDCLTRERLSANAIVIVPRVWLDHANAVASDQMMVGTKETLRLESP